MIVDLDIDTELDLILSAFYYAEAKLNEDSRNVSDLACDLLKSRALQYRSLKNKLEDLKKCARGSHA